MCRPGWRGRDISRALAAIVVYLRPRGTRSPGPNDVVIEALEHFHGLGLVYYTRIGSNLDKVSAENLAELAIASAEAVKGGELEKGKDGISYLMTAKQNGIVTPLMAEYEQQIMSKTGMQSLQEAVKKVLEEQ